MSGRSPDSASETWLGIDIVRGSLLTVGVCWLHFWSCFLGKGVIGDHLLVGHPTTIPCCLGVFPLEIALPLSSATIYQAKCM